MSYAISWFQLNQGTFDRTFVSCMVRHVWENPVLHAKLLIPPTYTTRIVRLGGTTIDERRQLFFYGWIAWDKVLEICNRYPYKVETKGGHEEFTPKTIVFTSNAHPSCWYRFCGFNVAPLLSDRINGFVKSFSDNTPLDVTYYNEKILILH